MCFKTNILRTLKYFEKRTTHKVIADNTFCRGHVFDKAKAVLKYEAENQLGIQSGEVKLTKWETNTITSQKEVGLLT